MSVGSGRAIKKSRGTEGLFVAGEWIEIGKLI